MYRILTVDDEELVCIMIKKMLESDTSYEVMYETKGRKAISVIKKKKPDLVILDVMMPDAKGTDILREIKENPATLHIPVIILTGSRQDKEELMAESMSSYADAFLLKPIDRIELHKKVSYILSSRMPNS